MSTLKDALKEKKDEIEKIVVNRDGSNNFESEDSENIDGLKIQMKIGNDDLEVIKAQAKKRSEAVYASASDYYKLTKRFKKLEDISGIELISDKSRELTQLREEKYRIDQHLSRQSQAIRDQFAINVLITEINDCQPEKDQDVLRFFYLLLNGGSLDATNLFRIHKRLQKSTIEYPSTIFFYDDNGVRHDFAHIPSQFEGRKGQISGTDKVLAASLRGLIKRYVSFREFQKEQRVKKDEEKLKIIKAQINGCDIKNLINGKPGTYTFFLPAKTEKGKKIGRDGAGIVRVKNLNERNGKREFWVVEAIDGAGFLKCFADNREFWVAMSVLRQYIKNRELSDRVPKERKETTLLFCKKLYIACSR